MSLQVRIAFIQMCATLFRHKDPITSHIYIQALASYLFHHLTHSLEDEQVTLEEITKTIEIVDHLSKMAPADMSQYRQRPTDQPHGRLMKQQRS